MTEATSSLDHVELCSSIIRQIAELHKIKEEEEIKKLISDQQRVLRFSDTDAEMVLRRVQASMSLFMDDGNVIKSSDHKSWYLARTRDKDMRFTRRNRTYLSEYMKLNSQVISKLDSVTNEIMDLFGDPSSSFGFGRRGLVIGDVQSGKTNTYTTLCCKAADIGYKVIILLTGTLESLRKQTQTRLDEGFVGSDSSALLKKDRKDAPGTRVGVGKIDTTFTAAVFTSRVGDFSVNAMNNLGLTIANTNDPILLVVKKNARILSNLQQWLERKNAVNGKINSSLLLIDDEADNASINTLQTETTAINSKLREILNLFTKSTYVGFTATPFANIFIDPESNDKMFGDDLFPKHFIYSLRSPSNHIGPSKMFGKKAPYSGLIRTIDDAEEVLPHKHPKDFKVKSLPDSLHKALNCFILSCAIRDLRGDSKKHMSMLINMSRNTEVQDHIRDMVQDCLDKIRNSVLTNCMLTEAEALLDPHIRQLNKVWSDEFANASHGWNGNEYTWEQVQKALGSSIKQIEVRSVNQRNGAKNLNYRDYPDGLRLIAIGGNSLSRGLTLEGLSISYFYRTSQTYDTLMQMGRWFGYRDGYDDLCRVWMTEQSSNWYAYISDATEELKDEIEIMQNENKTPENFGLLVREDVRGLYVTARSKMFTAANKTIIKSLSGTLINTPNIYADRNNVAHNRNALHRFIGEIEAKGYAGRKTDRKNIIWNGVPKRYVVDFLREFKSPEKNIEFDTESLVDFILSDASTNLDRWDVVAQGGSSEEVEGFGKLSVNKVIRNYSWLDGPDIVQMSRRQLSSPDNTKEGLTKLQIDELEDKYRQPGKEFSANTYLKTANRKPLLIIYPLSLETKQELDPNDPEAQKKREVLSALREKCTIGLAAGFPNAEGREKLMIKYKANLVYQRGCSNDPDLDEEE